MRLVFAVLGFGALLALGAACGDDAPAEQGSGATCGGRGSPGCAADEYCDFSNNRCGADDTTGRCVPRPASCPTLLIPERTCGCD
jgi:hypothetical protein